VETEVHHLNQLWENVISDYENWRVHDEFVRRCYSANNLAQASYRYGCLLSAIPNDEIALKMRNRIDGMAEIAKKNLELREQEKPLRKIVAFLRNLPRRIAQRLS
jgi:hypothetical protein